MQKLFEKLDTATIGYNGQYVNFAVAYGGRREIIHAVKKLCSKVKEGSLLPDEIDEKIFESCLYTSKISNPHPDLIIRTAGEKRLSGFLLWQCAYSELIFLDILWPEFEKKNLIVIYRDVSKNNCRMQEKITAHGNIFSRSRSSGRGSSCSA